MIENNELLNDLNRISSSDSKCEIIILDKAKFLNIFFLL